MIYGKLVPCTEFIGEEGLPEEKKKEMWVWVVSDDLDTQIKINQDISFKGTKAHDLYLKLTENPELTFENEEVFYMIDV